jgi:hypothetical protein
MPVPSAKRILQSAYNYTVRVWFTKEIPNAVNALADAYQTRDEITGGMGPTTQSGTTISASVVQVDLEAGDLVLNGRMMSATQALDNTDLLTTGDYSGGSAANSIGEAIYEDGADASGISLATDETAYCTLIVCNTDGSGGANEDDDDIANFVLVIAGTSTTYAAQTAHATSSDIQDAIEASTGVHAGVTGWQHVARFVWDENSASPTIGTITWNRNNFLAQ